MIYTLIQVQEGILDYMAIKYKIDFKENIKKGKPPFPIPEKKKLIGLPLVQKILRWRHTGFNVHSKVRTQTKREAERVGKYMIRYYGLYSNAHRGKIRKAEAQPSHSPIIEDGPTYVPSKGWVEMIRKVYEVDPLIYPSCGGKIKIISFIEEPKTIDRIIRHLELTFEAERPPPNRMEDF